MTKLNWQKFGKSLVAITLAALISSILTSIIWCLIFHEALFTEGLQFSLVLAAFAFVYMAIFGLPIQALMHRYQLDQAIWFIAAGLIAGGIPAWLTARESTADEHGMGSALHFGMTISDWQTIVFGAVCGLICALTFWLIRRPDRDERPA